MSKSREQEVDQNVFAFVSNSGNELDAEFNLIFIHWLFFEENKSAFIESMLPNRMETQEEQKREDAKSCERGFARTNAILSKMALTIIKRKKEWGPSPALGRSASIAEFMGFSNMLSSIRHEAFVQFASNLPQEEFGMAEAQDKHLNRLQELVSGKLYYKDLSRFVGYSDRIYGKFFNFEDNEIFDSNNLPIGGSLEKSKEEYRWALEEYEGYFGEIKDFTDMGWIISQIVCFLSFSTQAKIIILTGQNNEEKVIRSIKFEPQFYKAGVSILTHFAQIIREKYKDQDVEIRIEQTSDMVKMIVVSGDVEVETIQENFKRYMMVVKEQAPPESVVSGDAEVLEMKTMLRMARLEVQHKQEIIDLKNRQLDFSEERFRNIERRVDEQFKKLTDILDKSSASSLDAVKSALDLASLACNSADGNLKRSIDFVVQVLEGNIEGKTKDDFLAELSSIKEAKPSVFEAIHAFALNAAASGTIGNVAYSWFMEAVRLLPRG